MSIRGGELIVTYIAVICDLCAQRPDEALLVLPLVGAVPGGSGVPRQCGVGLPS